MVQKEGDSPLPPLFGNFPSTRAILENAPPKKEFTFAVVGDTKSVGTFESITKELRNTRFDFAVLLGNCSYGGTEEKHRYFRAECSDEYVLPFPVFYVAGNRDISYFDFPVSRFLATLMDKPGIDYVFAGDFHGYAQTKLNETTYMVTGGGGAHLKGKQFHHAPAIRVTPNSVDERIIQVNACNDLEDRIEKLAITEIWPWIQQNRFLAFTLNALGFILLVLLLVNIC